ncbi:transposase [Streptomyces sp. NPDC056930]|uniref:transposase n=1 Tax=Streptomyces sp. NPDC056930 TaxID=3345967 RepID=UPI003634BD10
MPLTDVQSAQIGLILPDRTPRRGGRWRDQREVIDAIAWKFQTGSQWVHLPEPTSGTARRREAAKHESPHRHRCGLSWVRRHGSGTRFCVDGVQDDAAPSSGYGPGASVPVGGTTRAAFECCRSHHQSECPEDEEGAGYDPEREQSVTGNSRQPHDRRSEATHVEGEYGDPASGSDSRAVGTGPGGGPAAQRRDAERNQDCRGRSDPNPVEPQCSPSLVIEPRSGAQQPGLPCPQKCCGHGAEGGSIRTCQASATAGEVVRAAV